MWLFFLHTEMVSVDNLKVEFGVKPLFSEASFVINPKDRIALVGKNGVGKSTLLKIIAGEQQPTAGTVSIASGETVGYLPQVMKLQDETTVINETRKAFSRISKLQKKIDDLTEEIAVRSDYESSDYMRLVEELTTFQERLLLMGAEGYEAEMEKTLVGLGFKRDDFTRPTNEFSGGWRMRIELAKILLMKPDVLLLDEPTNHLDIESIQWLEQFLAQSAKAVVMVSHDRAFINNVTNRTLEISCGKIVDYKVKYNEYVKLRAERREQQMRAYENQQKEIADTKAFIERFRYQATKAVQVQSKIKQLAKIVPIEIDAVDNRHLHLKFPPAMRSGDYPLICEDVAKTYKIRDTKGQEQDLKVFSRVNLTIKRGEKVAFVGRNGEGKTTLVKCIMDQIPFDGNLKLGYNVKIGYFAQNQAQLLDENLTVFETIDNVAKGEVRLRIKDILGAFMFGGEASDKKVKVLSGGERSRLAMIKLLLEPVNFLILDEPTNHLDMDSKDVLKSAIKAFDGTAVIVSHDREFLDGLVTKVYEFGGGKVKEHLGGIYDYLREEENSFEEVPTPSPVSTPSPTAPAPSSYQENKERNKKISRLQKQIKESEKRIEELENRLSELDKILCTPEGASRIELCTEYATIKQALDKEMNTWEDLSNSLLELQQ